MLTEIQRSQFLKIIWLTLIIFLWFCNLHLLKMYISVWLTPFMFSHPVCCELQQFNTLSLCPTFSCNNSGGVCQVVRRVTVYT